MEILVEDGWTFCKIDGGFLLKIDGFSWLRWMDTLFKTDGGSVG